jgi:hypothetical protein
LLHVLGGKLAQETADPELLMEMMELRESLSEARAARDAAQVERLASSVRDKAVATQAELAQVFATIEAQQTPDKTQLTTAQSLLGRLRYYRRFQDEVAQFEDEALP